MGAAAADRSGIGRDDPEVESRTLEYPAVRVVHSSIARLVRLLAQVEGVGVLHHEFPRPHDAEAGTHLVAKLGLDLIQVDRQLPVAAYFAPCDVGDDLFVGRPETEVPLVTIPDPQQLRPVLLPAAGLLPELGGLNGGHEHLERARRVHFLANDVLDLAQHPHPEGEPGVETRREGPDEPGTQHQPMADDLRVRGRFLDGGEERLRNAHVGWDPVKGMDTSAARRVWCREEVEDFRNERLPFAPGNISCDPSIVSAAPPIPFRDSRSRRARGQQNLDRWTNSSLCWSVRVFALRAGDRIS